MSNTYLDQENYSEPYQQSIEDYKNNPDVIAFDRLCYDVFTSDSGKELIEQFKNKFLYPSFCKPNYNNFETVNTYYEGFKEAFRLLINSVHSHQQRIEAENH